MNDISDHLPLITMLWQTRLVDKTPLKFESRCLTEDKLSQVREGLYHKDWVGLLNGTTNENFDTFSQIISDELYSHSQSCHPSHYICEVMRLKHRKEHLPFWNLLKTGKTIKMTEKKNYIKRIKTTSLSTTNMSTQML